VDTLSFAPDDVLPVAGRQFEIDQWEVFTVDAGQGAIVTRWKQMHHPLLFLFAGRINARCTVTMQPVGSDRTRMVFRADLASHDNLEDSPILGPAKRAYAKAAKDYFSKVRSALNSGATPTTRAFPASPLPWPPQPTSAMPGRSFAPRRFGAGAAVAISRSMNHPGRPVAAAGEVEVDRLEDRVANEELAKLRAESGNEYEALIVESGIKAKAIKNLLQEKEYEQLTADELTPLIEDFDKTVEAMRSTTTKKIMADSYVRSCDEFTKASKEMMRRIRDGKKFNESERRFIDMGSGWMVDGSPGKVIKAYNDMIMQRRFTRF